VLLRSIATVGSYTLLSRVLGFARDMMIASYLGAGLVSDCFFVAFKLPNFFRRLFAEGAFSAAFVPLFSHRIETEGMESARRFAEDAMAVLVAVLVGFTALMQIIMPWSMYVLAPGFTSDPEKLALAVTLTRITFPYLLLISLVSLQGGILNSIGRFASVAGTPVFLNLTMMGSLVLLTPSLPTPGHALSIGVTAGGVVQLLWLGIECHRNGMGLRLKWPRVSRDVKILLRRMAPGILGAGAVQINLMVDVIIASILPSGALSYLFYADRVSQLPLGVIGIAVGTAILPLLSRQLAAGNMEGAMANHNRAVEISLFFTVPAAIALLVIPDILMAGLFQRGAFTAADAQAAAAALAAYGVGLPAYVLIKVFVPGYYARGDTRTPVQYSIVSLVSNVVLNLALMGPLQHAGVALATALAAWINAVLLLVTLLKRRQFVADERLKERLPRLALASAVTGLGLFAGRFIIPGQFGDGQAGRIITVALFVIFGMGLFFLAARVLGVFTLSEIKSMMRRTSMA